VVGSTLKVPTTIEFSLEIILELKIVTLLSTYYKKCLQTKKIIQIKGAAAGFVKSQN